MLRTLLIALLITPALSAQAPPKPAITDGVVRVPQSMTLKGVKLDYESVTGTLPIKDDDGKTTANMFFIAYIKTGETAARPITFCFNGGPGSSSVWLHLGAFGPWRVAQTDAGEALPPPGKLIENEASLLDITDLVFIDPVSTGFSRAADGRSAKDFHGVTEDVSAVGEFIRLFLTRHNRWGSPKFVAGESYGTTRAAALAGHLQDRTGIRLNGIILVSAVLNFATIRFSEGNDLPYVLYLPSYAATAWHHKKLEVRGEFKQHIDEATKFANGEYLVALQKGATLPDAERKAVAAKLALLTGLSEDYVTKCDLRIDGSRFMRELLRDRGQFVGRYDSRYLGRDGNAAAERPGFDPSYAAVQGSYTESFNQYLRGTLKYESDAQYEILTGKVQPWNYGPAGNAPLNVVPTLRGAMNQNADLRVFVANGYYDLATPFAGTQYTMNHLSAEKAMLDRVRMEYYEAGHMMYLHKPSLLKLRQDLAAWYAGK